MKERGKRGIKIVRKREREEVGLKKKRRRERGREKIVIKHIAMSFCYNIQ